MESDGGITQEEAKNVGVDPGKRSDWAESRTWSIFVCWQLAVSYTDGFIQVLFWNNVIVSFYPRQQKLTKTSVNNGKHPNSSQRQLHMFNLPMSRWPHKLINNIWPQFPTTMSESDLQRTLKTDGRSRILNQWNKTQRRMWNVSCEKTRFSGREVCLKTRPSFMRSLADVKRGGRAWQPRSRFTRCLHVANGSWHGWPRGNRQNEAALTQF